MLVDRVVAPFAAHHLPRVERQKLVEFRAGKENSLVLAAEIVEAEEEVRINGLPSDVPGMRRLKAMGFSDARLAQLSLRSADMDRGMSEAVAAGGSKSRCADSASVRAI